MQNLKEAMEEINLVEWGSSKGEKQKGQKSGGKHKFSNLSGKLCSDWNFVDFV